MELIEMKIMYESKEPFHDKMLLFVLDSVKSNMLTTFEYIVTVMIENLLKLI